MATEDLSKLKIEKSIVTSRPGKRRGTLYLTAAVLIVILAVMFSRGTFTPAVKVNVSTVSLTYPSQAITILNASGYIAAQRKAAVASKTTGRLVWIGVEEGNRVRKGEIIAKLENEDVTAARAQAAANLNVSRSALEQAEAELKDATVSLEREKSLLERGYIAKADYDTTEARYKKSRAAVQGARAAIQANTAALKGADVALEYTLIRAPFEAVVLTKNADIGDIITPLGAAANAKAAVVTIADMGSLQVEVDVSESNLEKVKLRQPCEIQLDALPEHRFRGEVHMIVPTADRSKATVLVKVRFIEKDKRILPEMSAKVAFLSRPVSAGEQKPRVTLNPSAIVERKGKKTVFVAKDGRAIEAPVVVGPQLGDFVEVLGGVAAGAKVVTNPPAKLKNGTKIKIEEK